MRNVYKGDAEETVANKSGSINECKYRAQIKIEENRMNKERIQILMIRRGCVLSPSPFLGR
jgi:hypothetical protein